MNLQKHPTFFVTLLVTLIIGVYQPSFAATIKADYRFNNTLASSVGTAPALTAIGPGTNTFATENVGGTTSTVLTFPADNGLQLSPTTNTISSDSYSIVMLFRFSDVTSYKRILDFKNGTTDYGLYNHNGQLEFYSGAYGNTTVIGANAYVQVVLTRDGAKNVVGYVNGVQQFSFVDTFDYALVDTANTLRFFKDDGGEESAGAVARIRLYDGALSATEVAALDGTPGGGGGTASLRADYQLQNTYVSSVGTPPDLTNITQTGNAANSFTTAVVDGSTRTVVHFPEGNGLLLPGANGVVSNNSYSIVVLCRLDRIDSWRRLYDVTDGTSGDIGFYNYHGNFQHYSNSTGTGEPITANTWVQIVSTRDEVGNVIGYVNGAPQFSFTDTTNMASIDSAVRFFDSQYGGGYESAGDVARIRLYEGALTAAEVAALDRLPGANTPSLFVNDATINESSGVGTNATFTVTLSPSSTQTVTVDYATANGTATAGSDYTAKAGTLTFAPGVTTQTVNVAILGDSILEPDETFTFNLSNAGTTPITAAQGTGTIVNDDPIPSFSINDRTITEGDAGTSTATFTVSLSAPSYQTITVNCATANGTATAGSDYTAKTSTLTFAPGTTTKSFAVSITGDTVSEPDETFTVSLTAPTNATIYDVQGVGTITNDDISNGPISWWRAENNALDSVGNNHGTATGGVTYVTGQTVNPVDSGQAFNFDGTGYISIPDNNTLNPANLTITGWIKPDFTGRPRTSLDDDVILQKSLSGVGYSLFLIQDPQGVPNGATSPAPLATPSLQLQISGTTRVLYSSDPIPNDGDYHHVAASYDGTWMRIYIDGVMKGELSLPGVINHYNGTAFIGRDPDSGFGIVARNSLAAIDEVRLYNRALTTPEIQDEVGATPLTVSVTPRTVNETAGASAAVGTVTRSGSTATALTVNLNSSDTTEATVPASLQIPIGSTSATFAIASVQDNIVDGPQPVAIMGRAAGFISGSASLVVNDSPLFSINDATITEGSVGTQILNFTVTLSEASAQTVTVRYATADGTANAGDDYISKTGTLSFAPGTTTKNVAITINGDITVEPDETFNVNLTNATNATIADAQGIGTIINDDGGKLQFSSSAYDVSESAGSVVISVTRTDGGSGAVGVTYATSNGTATAPADYTAKTGTLSWADGDTTAKTFTVSVINDGVTEPDESVNLTLSNPTGGATLGIPSNATLNIADANPAGLLQFSAPTYSVNESGPTAIISVTRSGGSTGAVSVTCSTSDATGNGSATAGSDYTAKTSTLNWAAGDTATKTFVVSITQDIIVEGPEILNLTLSAPTNSATLGIQNTAVLTIVDDEPLPTIKVSNAAVDEGDTGTTPMTFTVTLSGPVTQNVLVNFKTGDTNPISATAGNDYTARRGTLTFPANTTSQTIVVQINGDTYREPDERFTMNLSNGVNVNLAGAGSVIQGIGTISNDDANPRPPIVGGPVVLMGVDTEDGGVGGHGPIESFVSVVNSILRNMTNDGQGILVIGGGKDAGDNPTTFWNEIALDTGQKVTYVNGAANISAQSFAGFAMLAVVSSAGQTGGGITQDENDALAGRRIDVANFVNSGGGLIGFSQDGLGNPYNYIDRLGVFTVKTGLNYSAITPTPEGLAIGITDEITGPWHDEYLSFPAFLSILATNNEDGEAAAIGGKLVTIGTTLSVNDVSIAEGNAGTKTLNFTVTLSAPTAETVTLNYATANGVAIPATGTTPAIGAATAGSDYVAKTGTLTFAPNGPLTQTVGITINGDTTTEPDEAFVLHLSNAAGASIADAQGIGTITNDDNVQAGSLQFSSPTYSVSESGPVATLSVTRTGGTGVAVGVSYATANITAVAPGDYTAKTGTLSWAAGDGAAKTITIPIIDDAVVEGNETFKVTLSAPTGGALIGTPNPATVTIADNDSPPPAADGGPLVLMGIDAEDGGVGSHGPIANYITIVNSILGKVANRGQGILVIGGGKNASDDVTTFWDAIANGTGKPVTYVNGAANISARSFAGFAMIAVASSAAETSNGGLTQVENDALATRRADVAAFVNTGGGLLGFSQSGLTTPYPYIEGFGTFTFNTELSYMDITPTPAGQAIGITNALDVIAWHDEYLTFPSFLGILATNAVSNKPAAIGGSSVVIGSTIRINDLSIIEGDTGTKTLSFTATLSQASTQTITVNYATANGTTNPATAGTDYVAKTGTLTFAPGVTTRPVSITINGDTTVEPNETFFVNLSNAVNGTISDARGVGTITNDDVATPGSLQFSVTAYSVNESSDTATITVTRTGGSSGAVGVTYATSNGTATAGSDYAAKTGTLSWADGDAASKTFTVQILNDTVAEANETISLTLSAPTGGATLGTPGSAQLTIVDNDGSNGTLPTLSINDVNVLEGNSVNVTVTLSAASNQSVTVNYATANGSALTPGDYSTKTGTLTIPAGQTKGIITVATVGDTLDELDETFFVNLSAATQATIADTQGKGIIIDNDSPPAVTINDVNVTEGDTGTKSADFTIQLSAASGQTISVNAIPSNGSARAPGDYVTGGARLVFAPGETTKTFSVPVQGDLLDEPEETVFVLLSSAVNCSVSRARGTLTIADNDSAPSITIEDVRIGEGNAGQRTAAFRLKLSAPSGQVVKVNYATANGTATVDVDYVAVPSTQIAFTAGNLYAYARVLINGDLLNEPDETFKVNLTTPVNATITDTQAIGTILNDDSAPSLVVDDVTITEGDTGTKNLTFTVTLSKASGQTVTVNYATADGVARSTSDYTAKNGTLSFAPGSALSKTVSIVVNGDTLFEADETFYIFLSGAVNASIGRARGVGTILNNDASG